MEVRKPLAQALQTVVMASGNQPPWDLVLRLEEMVKENPDCPQIFQAYFFALSYTAGCAEEAEAMKALRILEELPREDPAISDLIGLWWMLIPAERLEKAGIPRP